MKILFSIPGLLFLQLSSVLATESISNEGAPPNYELYKEAEQELKKTFWKFGASPLIYDVSYGIRTKNELKAHEHSINFHSLGFRNYTAALTYKYSSLKYKQATLPSRYHGIGWEIGYAYGTSSFVYPNIELIFGKEYGGMGKLKWVQTEVHLIPILVVSAFLLIDHVHASQNTALKLGAAAALTAVSVGWGF